ncbi:hypothetical protein [Shimia sediminis]|uniref:hypothetical protein n=1 Tax=Shimia sediminis TaxID=2497945 RepID=UPI0013DFA6BA|nr:hypothetical protein [Shimia sediminis]
MVADPPQRGEWKVVAMIVEDELLFRNDGTVDKTEFGPFLRDHHTLEALNYGMRKALE